MKSDGFTAQNSVGSRLQAVPVGDVSRAEVVWKRKVDRPFIGDASQDWDEYLQVRHPSRQHFLAMMANAAYCEALVQRCAGLERAIFLQMHS